MWTGSHPAAAHPTLQRPAPPTLLQVSANLLNLVGNIPVCSVVRFLEPGLPSLRLGELSVNSVSAFSGVRCEVFHCIPIDDEMLAFGTAFGVPVVIEVFLADI